MNDWEKIKLKLAKARLRVLRFTMDKWYNDGTEKNPENWRTINGSHVLVKNGKIVSGAGEHFKGNTWTGNRTGGRGTPNPQKYIGPKTFPEAEGSNWKHVPSKEQMHKIGKISNALSHLKDEYIVPEYEQERIKNRIKGMYSGVYSIRSGKALFDSLKKTLQKKAPEGNTPQNVAPKATTQSNQNNNIKTEKGENAFRELQESLKNVKSEKINKNDHELAESEIIEKLAGGDETKGSCSSLALAYIGNKCGFDVMDFRGGNSQDAFSSWENIKRIANLDGVHTDWHEVDNEAGDTAKILKSLEKDKEFYLAVGRHAAIVRNSSTNGLEYLEMQSHYKENNGWKPFVNGPQGKTVIQTLKKRFGCKNAQRVWGFAIPKPMVLMDVESFKNSPNFNDILEHINTEKSDQKKGAWGHEK